MNFIVGYKEEKSSLQYDVIWFIIRDCPNLMQITYSRVNNAWLVLENPCEALLWNSFHILGKNAHFFVLLILTQISGESLLIFTIVGYKVKTPWNFAYLLRNPSIPYIVYLLMYKINVSRCVPWYLSWHTAKIHA